MRILLVEDDLEAAAHLRDGLTPEGHEVEMAPDGRDGLIAAATGGFDVIVLDRMLPGLDGLTLLRALRGAGVHTPVLFLTALGGLDDKLEGLRAGGDDYLVKPFALEELSARVAALARRASKPQKLDRLRVGDLELDRLSRDVRRGGRKIVLKPREFELLEYMMLRRGQVVTRTMMLEDVWGFHFVPQTSVVESHISRLRAKIDRGEETELIRTFRGSGYMIDAA